MSQETQPGESCVIRCATHRDLPALRPLAGQFFREGFEDDPWCRHNEEFDVARALERFLSARDALLLVAQAHDGLAGFACVTFEPGTDRRLGVFARIAELFKRRRRRMPTIHPDRGYLVYLFVAPGHRRKGIATALFDASCDWLRKLGARRITLHVLARNGSARRLYEKLGMTETLAFYEKQL